MLNSLKFDVEFTTGKKISGDHKLLNGMSAITGSNEAGKSLRLEMIRYALFGQPALRAEAKTYKNLSVTLNFTVNGVTYEVTRHNRKALLSKGTEEIATGVTPVNNAIEKILGYDIEVFDVANACLQGQIEALTEKRPTERKQMVDRTIGLDGVDYVIDKVSADMTATRKAIETLEAKVIQKYEAPYKPEGYSEDIIESLISKRSDIQSRVNRKHYLNGLISGSACSQPVAGPSIDVPSESVDELYNQLGELDKQSFALQATKDSIANFHKASSQIKGCDVEAVKKFCTEDYAAKWQAYENWKAKEVSKPDFTQAELDFIREGFEQSSRCAALEIIECPSCHHEFDLHGKEIKTEFDFDAWAVAMEKTKVKSPRDIVAREAELHAYEQFIALPVQEKPDLDKTHNKFMLLPLIDMLEQMAKEGFDIDTATARVADFDNYYATSKKTINEKLASKKKFDEENAKYQLAVEKYAKYQALLKEHAEEMTALENVELEIATVNTQIEAFQKYETDMVKYEAFMEAQSEAVQAKDNLEMNLMVLTRVRKALVNLKPRVKTYLLPSLNHVASELIQQMTGGVRKKVVIDENFEIDIDDQPVKTLSGSGKAVANLAVRIALGMVLTNKVFSVFLADEIDAAMDDDRAAHTAECLKNLKGTISQIILVSHKEPEADHQIKV